MGLPGYKVHLVHYGGVGNSTDNLYISLVKRIRRQRLDPDEVQC